MADFTGIQAVTDTLRLLLLDRMELNATVNVRTASLDVDLASAIPYVNLFLYRVAQNPELRNQDLPGMAGPMAYGHPPLSLDLYYLITAAGDDVDDDRGAHRILGDAMLVLHNHPIIPQDDPVLHPELQGEVELLKISSEPLDIEDLSKLWTSSTSALRLGVAYKVTVVQLEATATRTMAKPVLEPPAAGPRVFAVPIDRPQIESVGVIRPPDTEERSLAYARSGDTLVVHGSSFYPGTRVMLGELDATSAITADSTGSTMRVIVPDDPELQAGVRRVQLIRDIEVGSHDVPLMRSGVTAFVLIPTLTSLSSASGAVGSNLSVTGSQLLSDDGPTFVIIGDRAVTPEPGATNTSVQIVVPQLDAHSYPVSVRVNGAESIDPTTFQVV